MNGPLPRVLVVEPHFVLRRTIVLAAARLGVTQIQEAASVAVAQRMQQGHTYDTIVLALDAGPPAEIERLLTCCEASRVIGIMPAGEQADALIRLQPSLSHLLNKPARVKDLLGLLLG